MTRDEARVVYTYLRPSQAAALAPGLLTTRKVRELIRSGALRAVELKGRYYTTREWVVEALGDLEVDDG